MHAQRAPFFGLVVCKHIHVTTHVRYTCLYSLIILGARSPCCSCPRRARQCRRYTISLVRDRWRCRSASRRSHWPLYGRMRAKHRLSPHLRIYRPCTCVFLPKHNACSVDRIVVVILPFSTKICIWRPRTTCSGHQLRLLTCPHETVRVRRRDSAREAALHLAAPR